MYMYVCMYIYIYIYTHGIINIMNISMLTFIVSVNNDKYYCNMYAYMNVYTICNGDEPAAKWRAGLLLSKPARQPLCHPRALCVYIYIYMSIRVCMLYIYIYIYIYIHIHTYIHAYIYIYTYTYKDGCCLFRPL